jgi:hypothetical protein
LKNATNDEIVKNTSTHVIPNKTNITVGFENYDSMDHGFSAEAKFSKEAVKVIIIKNS